MSLYHKDTKIATGITDLTDVEKELNEKASADDVDSIRNLLSSADYFKRLVANPTDIRNAKTDLNDITNYGVYFANSGYNSNCPISGYQYIIHFGHMSLSKYVQISIGYRMDYVSEKHIYIRTYFSEWSDWQELATMDKLINTRNHIALTNKVTVVDDPENNICVVNNKQVVIYLKVDLLEDATSTLTIGNNLPKPATKYVFLNILKNGNPYNTIGQAFVRQSDRTLNIEGITKQTCFIYGTYICE